MDIKKIEAFNTLVATRKFSDAADSLYISQSSLSKQISQLEKELGVTLFDRTHNGVQLTAAGSDFRNYASKAWAEYQHVMRRMEIYRSNGTIPLRIGALPLVDDYMVADCLTNYWMSNPHVQIEYFERSQANLREGLLRRKFDIVLARVDSIDTDLYAFSPLFTDELIVVCRSDSPLARRGSIDLGALRNERFIALDPNSTIHNLIVQNCAKHGFHPNIALHHSRHRMVLKAVEKGMGITIMPSTLVRNMYDKNLSSIRLDEPIQSEVGFVWLKNEPLSTTASSLIEFVTEDYKKHQ